jgi:hypothetical protein
MDAGGQYVGYRERVPEELKKAGRRTAERTTLWQAIVKSFEADGADGVKEELARQMNDVEEKLDAVFNKLEDML